MSTRKDYLPSNAAELLPWFNRFDTYLTPNIARLNVTAPQLTAIQAARSDFENALIAYGPAAAAAKAALVARREAQREAVELIRKAVRQIQAAPGCTDEDREQLGINVKKNPAPQPRPSTRPNVALEQVGGLTHVIRLEDASGTRAKPDEASAAKIYMKVATAAPANPDELPLVNIETRSRFEMTFPGSEIGKTAYYGVRWINNRGEEGPMSIMISGTIAA